MTRPDDWHLHLRDGPELAAVAAFSARAFARADGNLCHLLRPNNARMIVR
jgi:dihydroorotase